MLHSPAPDDLLFLFPDSQLSMRGRHTQRDPESHKTRTPVGVLQTAHTLLTRCSPASVSEVTEQSGLHRCSPGARPGTLVTPGPPPVFFFLFCFF